MRLLILLLIANILCAQTPKLSQAWIYDTHDSLEAAKGGGAKPALEVTPIYNKGRLFVSTPWGTVAALESTTGKELWRTDLKINPKGSYGDFTNRGLTLRNDKLYTGTVDGRLVCLEAKDGKLCPTFGNKGEIDLTKGLRRSPQYTGEYEVTSPPAIFQDIVITGSAIADNSRFDMASGEVRAFDLNTGALRWTFHPLDENTQAGGANTWSRIVADESTGLVFLPVGSASPDYYGSKRPGDNRHANSLVALHGKTGKLAWSFQTVHHDIWDYDIASPPELYEYKGKKAIAVGSKTGHLFLLNRLTGKPIFGVEERNVPASDVPGESSSPTQPFPIKPAPLVRHSIKESDISAADQKDRQACLDTLKTLRNEGIFTPPSERGTLVIPGNIGGMHWGGLAWARKDGILVAPVNDLPAIITLIPKSNFREQRAKYPDRETTEQKGTDFAMSRKFFTAPSGTPCVSPPWGSLVGINADSGDIAWKVQLGDWPNLGGPTISSKGILFIGADFSPYLRAFDPRTGKQLGQWQLPTSARATPMTFIEDGKEYIVIAAGGHNAPMSKLDTRIVAFRID
jgi:quinoprotein glucose dehydrogenase